MPKLFSLIHFLIQSWVCSLFLLGSISSQAGHISEKIAEVEQRFWAEKHAERIANGKSSLFKATGALTAASMAGVAISTGYLGTLLPCWIGINQDPESCSQVSSPASLASQALGQANSNLLIAAPLMAPYLRDFYSLYYDWLKKIYAKNKLQINLAAKTLGYRNNGLDLKMEKIIDLGDRLELRREILKAITPEQSTDERAVNRRYRILDDAIENIRDAIRDLERSKQSVLSHPEFLMYLRPILELPLETKELALSPNDAKQELSKTLTDTYDSSVVRFFHSQIDRVIDNSKLPFDSRYKDRVNLYLWGPGGTGKTESAMAFAQAFGLPFCKIEAASLLPRDFEGTPPPQQAYYEKKLYGKVGKFLECLIHSKAQDGKTYKNTVIFIDEIDHLFNSKTHGESFEQLFKEFLSGVTFQDKGTGIIFDTSDLIIIGAGNGPLIRRLDVDQAHINAINRRFSILEYKKCEFEKRKKIGVQKFLPNIAKARGYEVTSEDQEFVDQVLVPYDHERNEGVGGLEQVINSFVIHRKSGRDLNDFNYKEVFERTVVVPTQKLLSETSQDSSYDIPLSNSENKNDLLNVLGELPEEELKALIELRKALKTLVKE